ncbi:MAG: RNA polymerase sigma factor [Dethiobacter sp.]|jgi:RNA polymerase sigma-70 factor (ECF subfamily)|nr:MAG: RNA polymerase sigma factor [Dethiobacter sp.]
MDRSILENLYHQYFNKTYRTAYLVTGDHQMAEDATQEAFLKAFANIETLRDLEKFGSWVSVIASNYAIDLLRKKKKLIFTDNISQHADSNPSISPRESWEKTETSQEVREALSLLEPEEREILVLKYFNELSIREISAIIDMPAGTIKSRLFRARKKVKFLLQPGKDNKRQLNKVSTKF